ncbi:hypothetical protein QYE76_064714 [Lolium multiflorum]|uniref:Uncharacterized protein n=1 Tax=Lolium multiflorum TaxID=4521 RepID=A0AAD8WA85_LOLMU|nr:hypothetical protein QYE76_064714 [Lolium multiflorum]
MAVVHRRLSLLGNGGKHVDYDDGSEPTTDEKLATVVGQQSKAVDDCDDPDCKDEFVPLRGEKVAAAVGQQAKAVDDCDDPNDKIMRPTSVENGQERRPGFLYKQGARMSTGGNPGFRYKLGARMAAGYKRKEWKLGSKSSSNKKEEKPTLVDSIQLVRPTRFKVYISPENRFTTTGGASDHLSFDTSTGSNTLEEESSDEDKDPEVTPSSGNTFSDDANFDAVKSFEDFNIILDDLIIDRELLPGHVHRMYYQLCCERKAFLHRHLLKCISPALTAGLIAETVAIAEGISSSYASSSSLEDLAFWKTTLEAFEGLGMDVAFLRKRVDDLHVVVLERDRDREKMRALKSEMSSLNDALEGVNMELDELEESVAKMKKVLAMP